MDKSFSSQISRAKELLSNLEQSLNSDLAKQNISDKTLNLTQEVLLKMRHLLDQAMHKFFEKHYLPKLSKKEAKTARVYFPIVSKKDDIKSVLGRAKMTDLETSHSDFYKFIKSIQPYNKSYEWLKNLSKFANEKHVRLTPQIRKERKTMTAKTKNVSVSMPIDSPDFSVKQGSNCHVSIGGVPVRFTNRGIIPLSPGLQTEVTKWVSFLFEDSDVNVLWLCKKSVEDGQRIVKKLLEFVY